MDLGSVDGNKQGGLTSVTESLSCLVQLHISRLLAYVGVPSLSGFHCVLDIELAKGLEDLDSCFSPLGNWAVPFSSLHLRFLICKSEAIISLGIV